MATQVFVNFPVKDLDKSKAFFSQLGYTFNSQFTDEKAACMVISDTIYSMLVTEAMFKTFTPKTIADGHTTKEVIVCLSCESRAKVDETIQKAVAAGGTAWPTEPLDHGFMYYHGFQDLDGHHWEIMFMEPSHVQA
ncbi:MAG: glyoxalase/bleomycin resistance/extradiol dioxygenase family protein [Cellvibrio sp. 79]|nr:MAG: glyoxalase/bleomycin resistance/extradiol dioxygenase family protein [Cellvibrio sp. 79]